MTTRLYLVPLPDVNADTLGDEATADIQSAGLLDVGGTATEKIAADRSEVDLTGRWAAGKTLTVKLASELESLAESQYTALPLFDPDDPDLATRAYYELERAEARPDHPTSKHVYEYDATLTKRGTHETHWRAVKVSTEPVNGLHGTGDPALVGVHADATKTQWFDPAEGTEPATPTDTVSAEFGDVARFNPADATATDPALIYELPFEREAKVDVRLWDTRGGDKFVEVGEDKVNQWIHAFDEGYEFDGVAVVDTGRLRLYCGEDAAEVLQVAGGETFTVGGTETETFERVEVESTGTVRVESGGTLRAIGGIEGLKAETWDPTTESWTRVEFPGGGWKLIDADFERVGPAQVQIHADFTDAYDNTATVRGVMDRGADTVLWSRPENEDTIPGELTNLLGAVARQTDTDRRPTADVIARSDTRTQ